MTVVSAIVTTVAVLVATVVATWYGFVYGWICTVGGLESWWDARGTPGSNWGFWESPDRSPPVEGEHLKFSVVGDGSPYAG